MATSRDVVSQQHLSLGQNLWSWEICGDCAENKSCKTDVCPSKRMIRLACFFKHYKLLTVCYEPNLRGNSPLRTHDDIIFIISQLRSRLHIPRIQLTNHIFDSWPDRKDLPLADRENILDLAVDLAVKAMTMVNCSKSRQSWELLEHGASQVPWRAEDSFCEFFLEAFPQIDHPNLNGESKSPLDIKPFLAARKLKKRLGLTFRATDDVRRHLKLDRKRNTLEIFHHSAFLKEHLRLTKDEPADLSLQESLTR